MTVYPRAYGEHLIVTSVTPIYSRFIPVHTGPHQNIKNYDLRTSKIIKLKDTWSKRKVMMAVKDVEKLSPDSTKLFNFILNWSN